MKQDQRVSMATILSDLNRLRARMAPALTDEEQVTLTEVENRLRVLADAFQRFPSPDHPLKTGDDGITWAFAKDLSK